MSKFKYYLPSIFIMIVIFYLSSRASTGIGGSRSFQFIVHKSLHLFVYGILASSYYYALKNTSRMSNRIIFILSLFLAGFYGITDEFHQSFVPGRGAKFSDVFFDFAGAYLGLKIFLSLPKAK